jgi:F-type H+-transporting ATPase subunit b
MEINWVTVAAQIVNFLVLVWLLNKFLYGPITRAMTARQTRIRERLADAARTRREAEEERRKLIAERNELLNTKEKLLTAVRAEADQLQRDLERQARDDVEAQRQAWLSQIQTDKEDFLNDVRQRAATEYFALAETAFSELAGETLEKRMVSVFVMRLKSMEESILRKLKASAEREECVMRIESAFLLGPDERHDINQCIANIMGRDVNIDYAKTDTMIAGIRLRIESQSIEWSINNYLDQLQERLREYFAAAAPHEDRQAAE